MPAATATDKRVALLSGLAAFAVVMVIAIALVWSQHKQQRALLRSQVAADSAHFAAAIEGNLSRALSTTYLLAAMVRDRDGEFPEFERFARELTRHLPEINSLQLAPQGVVTQIFPLAGNEAAIGHDLLLDPARNELALEAKRTGKLTVAGPFRLVQGGTGIVGRMPVFLDPGEVAKTENFWGFAIALLDFDRVLGPAGPEAFEQRGYRYELVNTTAGYRAPESIAGTVFGAGSDTVDTYIRFANANWTLRVAPTGGWSAPWSLAAPASIGFLLALVAAYFTSLLAGLVSQRRTLEQVVRDRTADLEVVRGNLELAQRLARVGSLSGTAPGDRVDLTREAGRILGTGTAKSLSLEELAGRILPEDRGRFLGNWKSAAGGTPSTTVVRTMGDPEPRWLRCAAERLAGDGSPKLIATVQDISEQKVSSQMIADSERRFRDIVEASADWIWEVDPEGRYTFTSESVTSLLGYQPGELLGRTAFDIMPPDEAKRVAGEFREIVASRKKFRDLYNVVLDKQGNSHDTLTSGTPIIDAEGRLTGYRGLDRDVTARMSAERRMREAMVVFNASSQGIFTTDARGIIRSANPAFTEITGYSADDAIGRTPAFLKSGRHQHDFYKELWRQLNETGSWEGEIWNRRRNGEVYPEWLTITTVHTDDGKVAEYVALFSDITRRKQQEYAIWRQANFDALTGLANRSLQYDRLEQAIVHARRVGARVGLVFIDLDDFKTINDTLGHEIGDKVLVDVAARLQGLVREQDTVSRIGGDEFTIILEDVARIDHIKRVGNKVVEALDKPFQLQEHTYYLSGSAGIAVFPDDGNDVHTLMRHADIAMYSAKRSGKRRVRYFDERMQKEAEQTMRLESDLRQALAENRFHLAYQPIVDATSGRVECAEALLRWEHPRLGPIGPDVFIPIAEQCGLIVELGGWVIEQALKAQQCWRSRHDVDIAVAVNVSGIQFRERGLGEVVGSALGRYPHPRLVLEITETVLSGANDMVMETMQDIRAHGAHFSLDDFGKGFSSLSYLRQFPLASVKIDRDFVLECGADDGDARMVEAIVNMAHSLDLVVIAEGVEDNAQLGFLRGLGCDQIQGFLASKPVSPEDFEQLLAGAPLLAAPTDDRASRRRLLARLLLDEEDVDRWVADLLGEGSPGHSDYIRARDRERNGLTLRDAIESHLVWRQRLNDMISGIRQAKTMASGEVRSTEQCALGRWIRQLHPVAAGSPDALARAHRDFHEYAARILGTQQKGDRLAAFDMLVGPEFREISRRLVLHTVSRFKDQAGQEP